MHSKDQIHWPKVLVIDSGVGALTVFKELWQRMPKLDYVLGMDLANYPYGKLKEAALIGRLCNFIEDLVRRESPSLIVLACNTASTIALTRLRASLDIPIVGVVPAVKPAAAMSHSKVIGLLATEATISRGYTDELIASYASECEIIRIGSPTLVDFAHRKAVGEELEPRALVDSLRDFNKRKELDTIILACTHFPLLEKELSNCLSSSIQLINSGSAIADRVFHLLQHLNLAAPNNKTKGTQKLYASAEIQIAIEFQQEYFGEVLFLQTNIIR